MYKRFNRHSDILPNAINVQKSIDDFKFPLNPDKISYESLGDKIRISRENGDVLGVTIAPEFDTEDVNDIDVNTAHKLDAFDIYEMSGDKPNTDNPLPNEN